MQKKSKIEEYQEIDLNLIDEPEGRIRLDVESESIRELADNIKEVGQIQPIKLAKNKTRFEIVAGHRRFLAVKSLGYKKIKAITGIMTPEQIALERASENLLRTDLTPIEEGAVYADLAEKYNMSLRQIGDKFGKAASGVKRMINLLTLEPEIQQAIHKNSISMVVGVELNKIDESKQRAYYLETAIENGCTSTTAETWVKDFRRASTPGRAMVEQGVPLEVNIQTNKIYQACEICEEPVEMQKMKMLRICPGCFKIIIDNLKQGG
jgi:ParB family chromosome partitioning protein